MYVLTDSRAHAAALRHEQELAKAEARHRLEWAKLSKRRSFRLREILFR